MIPCMDAISWIAAEAINDCVHPLCPASRVASDFSAADDDQDAFPPLVLRSFAAHERPLRALRRKAVTRGKSMRGAICRVTVQGQLLSHSLAFTTRAQKEPAQLSGICSRSQGAARMRVAGIQLAVGTYSPITEGLPVP